MSYCRYHPSKGYWWQFKDQEEKGGPSTMTRLMRKRKIKCNTGGKSENLQRLAWTVEWALKALDLRRNSDGSDTGGGGNLLRNKFSNFIHCIFTINWRTSVISTWISWSALEKTLLIFHLCRPPSPLTFMIFQQNYQPTQRTLCRGVESFLSSQKGCTSVCADFLWLLPSEGLVYSLNSLVYHPSVLSSSCWFLHQTLKGLRETLQLHDPAGWLKKLSSSSYTAVIKKSFIPIQSSICSWDIYFQSLS